MVRLIIVAALVAPAQTGSGQTVKELVANLCSDDLDKSEAAERELHDRLNALSDSLMKIISATQTVEKNRAGQRKPIDRALSLLDKLDHRKAARLLMMNVCYFDHSDATKASFITGYPCAKMLSGLGPTAAYEIVTYLEHPPTKADLSDKAIDLFARVFRTVFSAQNGGDEEAIAVLVRARRRAKNTQHIERLEKRFRELIEGPKPVVSKPNVP